MTVRRYWIGLCGLLLAMLACEPVITIGVNEFLVIVVIVLILLGIPFFRFLRQLEDFRKARNRKKGRK